MDLIGINREISLLHSQCERAISTPSYSTQATFDIDPRFHGRASNPLGNSGTDRHNILECVRVGVHAHPLRVGQPSVTVTLGVRTYTSAAVTRGRPPHPLLDRRQLSKLDCPNPTHTEGNRSAA